MISSVAWGVILVILGLALIVRTLFGISIPLLRIALGLLLTYAGIGLLSGPNGSANQQDKITITFAKDTIAVKKPKNSYDTIMGFSTIDLTNICLKETGQTVIDMHTIMGNTIVLLDPNVPTEITAQATVGNVQFPQNKAINFGIRTYKTHGDHLEPKLAINAQVVLGNLEIHSNEEQQTN